MFYKGFSAVVVTRSGLSYSTCILQKVNKKRVKIEKDELGQELEEVDIIFLIYAMPLTFP